MGYCRQVTLFSILGITFFRHVSVIEINQISQMMKEQFSDIICCYVCGLFIAR